MLGLFLDSLALLLEGPFLHYSLSLDLMLLLLLPPPTPNVNTTPAGTLFFPPAFPQLHSSSCPAGGSSALLDSREHHCGL